jgi:hypothetical protein
LALTYPQTGDLDAINHGPTKSFGPGGFRERKQFGSGKAGSPKLPPRFFGLYLYLKLPGFESNGVRVDIIATAIALSRVEVKSKAMPGTDHAACRVDAAVGQGPTRVGAAGIKDVPLATVMRQTNAFALDFGLV